MEPQDPTQTPASQRDPSGLEVNIGLSLDTQGRFSIRGEPVTHQRTHEVLLRGLHAGEDGSVRTRIGYEWSRVDVADTPLLVVGVAFETTGIWLALSDGTAERLEPRSLWLEGERLYARVRAGTLAARFQPAAGADLLLRVLEEDQQRPTARFGDLVVDLGQSKR